MKRKFAFLLVTGAIVFTTHTAGCQVFNSTPTRSTPIASPTQVMTATVIPSATHTPTPTFLPTNTPYPPPQSVLAPENASQIRQLTRFGKGGVNALAYSPDGKYLVIGTALGMTVYDTDIWVENIIDLETSVLKLEFSPKGDILCVGLDNGVLQLWDVSNWSILRTLLYTSVEPFVAEKNYWQGSYRGLVFRKNVGKIENVLAFSPDGTLLAAGGEDALVKIWQVSDGSLQKTITVNGSVDSIAFTSDGKHMAISTWDTTLWQTSNWEKEFQFLTTEFTFVENLEFSADDKSLIGWSGSAVIIWQTSDGTLVNRYEIPTWGRATDLSPDGKTLAVAHSFFDGDSLEIWDIQSATKRELNVDKPALMKHVVFHPDGHSLAVSSFDGTIKIVDLNTDENLRVLNGFFSSVDDIQPFPDGTFYSITAIHQYPFLQEWELKSGLLKQTVDLDAFQIEAGSKFVFSPDGAQIAIGSKDLRLWDFRKTKSLTMLESHTEMPSGIKDAAFSPDGDWIAYSYDYEKMRLTTTANKTIRMLDGVNSFDTLCIFEDKQILTTGIQYWDLNDGTLIEQISNYYGLWYFFTPGCDLFASMTWDGHFKVLRNTEEKFGVRVGDFDLRAQGVYFMNPVAFSPDEKLVAVQEAIGRIRIFDLQTTKTLAVLKGHQDTITSLHFSPDGKMLISSSQDGTIRLWGISP